MWFYVDPVRTREHFTREDQAEVWLKSAQQFRWFDVEGFGNGDHGEEAAVRFASLQYADEVPVNVSKFS